MKREKKHKLKVILYIILGCILFLIAAEYIFDVGVYIGKALAKLTP